MQNEKGFQITAAEDAATIYIYGGINMLDRDGFFVDKDEFISELKAVEASNIEVRIASVGGDPVAAGEMYQALVDHPATVTTVNESKAYSAGSMLLQAGDQRLAKPMSIVMVHGPASDGTFGRGTAKDHREVADALEAHARAMMPAYTRHGIDEETVSQWLNSDQDIYFDAQSALQAKLIDSIIDGKPIAASAPKQFQIAAMGGDKPKAAESRAIQEHAEMADANDLGTPAVPKDNPDILATHSRTVEAAIREGANKERKRAAAITAVFEGFDTGDHLDPVTALHAACLADVNCDELAARTKLLNVLKARSENPVLASQQYGMSQSYQQPPNASRHLGGSMEISSDQADRRAKGISAALQIKAGMITDRETINRERKGEFLSMSLIDIMAHEMRGAGYTVAGGREDIARAYVRAMPILAAGPSHGTDHLPSVLGDIANKSAMMGWDGATETWNQWTTAGTLNNYLPHTRANIGLLDTLTQMQENQQWEYGDMSDVKQRITGYFYGLKYGLSIQALVNDELGELTRTMQGWGEAASATVGDTVFTLLTATGSGGFGQSMDEDSTVLFHADHGNYIASGSGAAPSKATISAGRSAMITQTDPNANRTIAARPQYLLHGTTLTMDIFTLLNSQANITGEDATVGERNPVASLGLRGVEEWRFDNWTSTAAWILAASRRTVEVAGVGGPVQPRAEQSMISDTPGITYELSMPFGAAALDYRGLYFNYGA